MQLLTYINVFYVIQHAFFVIFYLYVYVSVPPLVLFEEALLGHVQVVLAKGNLILRNNNSTTKLSIT